mmetsp:Transcript_105409/g.227231  ORF Transcript_105409/g.227231 Transcript_105409/m.227231 type:complete len:260 (-) Transcript_105409:80-859(-)
MFQREFCMRLSASPGNEYYSRISCNVQLLAKVEHLFKVSRDNFRPPPKVESSVVKISPKNTKILENLNYIEWEAMTLMLFNHKNKTIRSILFLKCNKNQLLKHFKKDLNQESGMTIKNKDDREENKILTKKEKRVLRQRKREAEKIKEQEEIELKQLKDSKDSNVPVFSKESNEMCDEDNEANGSVDASMEEDEEDKDTGVEDENDNEDECDTTHKSELEVEFEESVDAICKANGDFRPNKMGVEALLKFLVECNEHGI